MPAAQVADSLGLEDYSTLVRRQQARGRLDGRGLSRLAAALGGVRYLVVARLGADELESGVSVEEKLALEIRDV